MCSSIYEQREVDYRDFVGGKINRFGFKGYIDLFGCYVFGKAQKVFQEVGYQYYCLILLKLERIVGFSN